MKIQIFALEKKIKKLSTFQVQLSTFWSILIFFFCLMFDKVQCLEILSTTESLHQK